MPDFYRVRVQAVSGKFLTCQVTQLEEPEIDCSRTLAFGFLVDTTRWLWWMNRVPNDETRTIESMQAVAESTQLGRALSGHEFFGRVNQEEAGEFISCVGVVDRCECDYQFVGNDSPEKVPQATYHIAVTSAHWLEHLAPGMEWESRAWDQDKYAVCSPAWRTTDVMLLARSIDQSQDFSGLPILADALQEAGCDSDDILTHFRDPHATHVRGCWALDLVLGRE